MILIPGSDVGSVQINTTAETDVVGDGGFCACQSVVFYCFVQSIDIVLLLLLFLMLLLLLLIFVTFFSVLCSSILEPYLESKNNSYLFYGDCIQESLISE